MGYACPQLWHLLPQDFVPYSIFCGLCLPIVVAPSCSRFQTLLQYFCGLCFPTDFAPSCSRFPTLLQFFLLFMLTHSCGTFLLKILYPSPIFFVGYANPQLWYQGLVDAFRQPYSQALSYSRCCMLQKFFLYSLLFGSLLSLICFRPSLVMDGHLPTQDVVCYANAFCGRCNLKAFSRPCPDLCLLCFLKACSEASKIASLNKQDTLLSIIMALLVKWSVFHSLLSVGLIMCKTLRKTYTSRTYFLYF